MNAVTTSPTARLLGRELQRDREAARVSVEAAARTLQVAPNTIRRIEDGEGKRPRREVDIRLLAKTYGEARNLDADAVEKRAAYLVSIAQEWRNGWWKRYDDVPEHLAIHLAAEHYARRLRQWEPLLMPGLVQTKAYARGVALTQPGASPDDVEAGVRLRMARKEILTGENPPSATFVLAEHVLYLAVGGQAVLAEQLDYLIAAAARPNIEILIIPNGVPSPGINTGGFELLDPRPDSDGVTHERASVYAEGYGTSAGSVDSPEVVGRFRAAFEGIQAAAEDRADSLMIMKHAREAITI